MLSAVTAAPPDKEAPAPAKSGKVELDLDGAPFLAKEEPPKAKEEPKDDKKPPESPPKVKPKKSKKKFLLILAPVVLLILGGLVYFLFLRGPTEEEIPPEVVVVPSVPVLGPPPAEQVILELDPFWVELLDQAGEVRLLTCKISIPVTTNDNTMEFNVKKAIIRDAFYYYLKNRPYDFLSASKNLDVIKNDLVSIMNEYITTDKIKEVLLTDYIIR